VRRPWVKTPATLRLELGLHRIPAGLERTFWALWPVARREPRLIGWLVGDDESPLSLRELRHMTLVPRSTLGQHLDRLVEHGLLAKDAVGRFLIPSVALTEIRFAAGRRSGDDTVQIDVSPAWIQDPLPVENGARAGPEMPETGTGVSRSSRTPPLYGFEKEPRDVRHVVFEQAGENPPDGPRFDLVPESVTDPTSRYLLAKLAAHVEAWGVALERPRDRGNIGRLAASHPAELCEALQQEALEPSAKNPAAWLNAVVGSKAVAS
jgi:DNA-binding transcriptional ArsR family regulator